MAVSSIGTYKNAYEGISVMQKKEGEADRQKKTG